MEEVKVSCWARPWEQGGPLGWSQCSSPRSPGRLVTGVALVLEQSKGTRAEAPSRENTASIVGGGEGVGAFV